MADDIHPESQSGLEIDLDELVNAVVTAVVSAYQTGDMDSALVIRDELRRLPDALVTETLNATMLRLMQVDPALCRWFILDVFLYNADPEGKADVAERLNLLLADLQSQLSND